ncbi:lipocalin family protein [Pseudoalteromonas luteoviolacea]|uniref:lipocalin family protein n=1 Tax=Pseudoalteromonas luteoviolacea TaxID=43657 RepID=UPI001B367DC6|nr:lipocalin family protein [Pseudoalteromonas luteoviolacea]MBQ4813268.1 lipocalin family protein [Pseudoalteromonas luteoviolacea]
MLKGQLLRIVFVVWVSVSVIGCTGLPEGVQPVKSFDVQRYQGVWYEIARLDHRFERGMDSVTATYEVQSDGTVTVLNRGYVVEDGQWKQAEGVAKFVSDPTLGHLKVSFFGPFYGSYVVFKLDKENYEYAYVTSYNKDYLWLLSRTPKVSEAVLKDFQNTVKELGYSVDELIYMKHTAAMKL